MTPPTRTRVNRVSRTVPTDGDADPRDLTSANDDPSSDHGRGERMAGHLGAKGEVPGHPRRAIESRESFEILSNESIDDRLASPYDATVSRRYAHSLIARPQRTKNACCAPRVRVRQ